MSRHAQPACSSCCGARVALGPRGAWSLSWVPSIMRVSGTDEMRPKAEVHVGNPMLQESDRPTAARELQQTEAERDDRMAWEEVRDTSTLKIVHIIQFHYFSLQSPAKNLRMH
eukprot:SAG31_NODE_3702_length_3974_cov_13.982452_5_plen_113_part_00